MQKLLTVKFNDFGLAPGRNTPDEASKFFQEWTALGGLTESINQSMAQNIGLAIQLTDSGPDLLVFSVYQVPPPLKNNLIKTKR